MPKRPKRILKARRLPGVLYAGPPLGRVPNYLPLQAALIERHRAEFKPGDVRHCAIYHDDWCAIWAGRACNCNPTVDPLALGEAPPNPAPQNPEAN